MSLGRDVKAWSRRNNETTSLLMPDDDEEGETSGDDIIRYGEYSDDELERSDEFERRGDILRTSSRDEDGGEEDELLPIFTIISILSSSFAYGCIMTTLFLITLPIECERIEKQNPDIPKSVSLVWICEPSKSRTNSCCAPHHFANAYIPDASIGNVVIILFFGEQRND